MNDIATLFENLDREKENDLQSQLAESDQIVNEDESWVEGLNREERNKIEILLADQELDERMHPIWKDAIDDIWHRFWAIWKICEREVQSDEVEYLLWMIGDVEYDMSVWSNNDPYEWEMVYGYDGNESNIHSDVYIELDFRREFLEKYLEEIKGKNNN